VWIHITILATRKLELELSLIKWVANVYIGSRYLHSWHYSHTIYSNGVTIKNQQQQQQQQQQQRNKEVYPHYS